jgi:hypothetical protein
LITFDKNSKEQERFPPPPPPSPPTPPPPSDDDDDDQVQFIEQTTQQTTSTQQSKNAFQTLMARKKETQKTTTKKEKKETKPPKKDSSKETCSVTGSRFVDCPTCGKSVFYREIETHVESHLQDQDKVKPEPVKKEIKSIKPGHDEDFSLIAIKTDDGMIKWKWNWNVLTDSKKKQQKTILAFTKKEEPPTKRKKTRQLADVHYELTAQETKFEDDEYVSAQQAKIYPVRTVGSYDASSNYTPPSSNTRNQTSTQIVEQTNWDGMCNVRVDKQDVRLIKITTDFNKPFAYYRPASATATSNPTNVIFSATTASTQYAHTLSKSSLKSLLQKSVRLGRADSAVRIAKLLMQINFTDFVRRLLIIMVEDAILHPAFPWLLWLMMADSKSFVPSLTHLNTCLQIVHQVASVKFHDEMPCDDNIGDLYEKCGQDLHPFEANLVKSLITRALFGGMTGDCKSK